MEKPKKIWSFLSFVYKSSILDLVSDNVRNRFLTVCVLLLVYIYAVFTIIGLTSQEPLIISDINTVNIIHISRS